MEQSELLAWLAIAGTLSVGIGAIVISFLGLVWVFRASRRDSRVEQQLNIALQDISALNDRYRGLKQIFSIQRRHADNIYKIASLAFLNKTALPSSEWSRHLYFELEHSASKTSAELALLSDNDDEVEIAARKLAHQEGDWNSVNLMRIVADLRVENAKPLNEAANFLERKLKNKPVNSNTWTGLSE